MLLTLCLALLTGVAMMVTVAVLALLVLRRMGMDPIAVLLWLGIAEEPTRQPRKARPRLAALTPAGSPPRHRAA